MYEIKLRLTKENILSFVSEWDVFKYYIPALKYPNTPFRSELREDNNPSCRVTKLSNGWRYKDFAISGTLNCIQYVMVKFNLSYKEALEKIRSDFNLNEIEATSFNYDNKPIIFGKIPENKSSSRISIKERRWSKLDKDYWYDKYNITKEWLIGANIIPISHFYISSDSYKKLYLTDSLAYCFNYGVIDNVKRRKIYQPYSEKKWVSNVNTNVVQGYHLLPRNNNLLVITSSLKDVGTLWCNANIFAIAPNSEASFIPEVILMNLKERFERIVIWFNNDEPGILNAKKYSKLYGLEYVFIPEGYPKDPSDFVEKYGMKDFIHLCDTLLNKTKN
jgi:hypothetical protein